MIPPSHLGDPNFEPENARWRFIQGETDPGSAIAIAQFLSDPDNLRDPLAVLRNLGEPPEDLVLQVQGSIRILLVNRVLAFLGADGTLPLSHGIGKLRSVIESLPKGSKLLSKKNELLGVLDEIQDALDAFTFDHFSPAEIPLTPAHIEALQRLGVISVEKIQSLLGAIQYYGASFNYGAREERPAFKLIDFYDSLMVGEFLHEFLTRIASANKVPFASALAYVRAEIAPALIVVLTETAERHHIEVKSIGELYELVPLGLEDMLEDVRRDMDPKARKKRELLIAAFRCILKEMPDFESDLPFDDEEGLGEDWVADEGEGEDTPGNDNDLGFDDGEEEAA